MRSRGAGLVRRSDRAVGIPPRLKGSVSSRTSLDSIAGGPEALEKCPDRTGRTGRASLTIQKVAGGSTVVSAFACAPLKLFTPRARGASVWACLSNLGGGIVAGDQTRFDLELDASTRCWIGTQAATKIYGNRAQLPSAHQTHATIGSDSILVFTPDPVQAFASAAYSQRQEFHLATSSGLVLLDGLTSGRAARGERWAFSRFASRNEVWMDNERIFLDALVLDGADGDLAAPFRAGRFNCLMTLLILGSPFQPIASSLLEEIGRRPVHVRHSSILSASPVRDGVVVRLAAEEVESVQRELRPLWDSVSACLGDNPWSRRY